MKYKTLVILGTIMSFFMAGVVNIGTFFLIFGGIYPLELVLFLSGGLAFGAGYITLYFYRRANGNARTKNK